jgi:hypothetical protein
MSDTENSIFNIKQAILALQRERYVIACEVFTEGGDIIDQLVLRCQERIDELSGAGKLVQLQDFKRRTPQS